MNLLTPDSADQLSGLIAASARSGDVAKPRPVERWNPPDCGEIDMVIRADGTWLYGGSPIGRAALVRLFASILRRDADRYVLVTPAEKVGIRVEDAPFIATAMRSEPSAMGESHGSETLVFETNVGDVTQAGKEHPMRFEIGAHDGVKPYVHVRGGLWARLTRALSHDLIDLAVEREEGGESWLGVASGGAFFPICRTSATAGVEA
ncbi:MAG: DUF1285 domain-containing protein [Hyphomicrobiales bacterium]